MWKHVDGPEATSPANGEWALGSLIGRERESAALKELLAARRLMTLTGGTGVGKSRLAESVVAGMAGMPGAARKPWQRVVRVRWHSNRPGPPGTLTAAICRALAAAGAPQGSEPAGTGAPRRSEPTGPCPPQGSEPADIGEAVRLLPPADILLFLDDVDPVHGECVGVVQRLLMAAPTLRVLVTSRRALGLGDENVLRLSPLSLTADDTPSGRPPAVELFLDRARTSAPEFRADGADGAVLLEVDAICRSLEGVPLAIELAADQLARRTPRELAQLVEGDQCRLASPHARLRRHRSLRDAVGAGYALCDREVRIVWGRASIFAGPFDESTAVFMCSGGGVEPHHVAAHLAQLAAIGVLEAVRDPGGTRRPRYRMARAARDFGAERLRQAGEFAVAVERRSIHCRRVAAVAENLWSTGCQSQAVRLVQDEQSDLRAMVGHALVDPGYATVALETVVNLWFRWAVYDGVEEGRTYLRRLLPSCPTGSPLAARAHWLAAWLTASTDPFAAGELLREAWPAAVLAGDDATIGRIAHVQGVLALRRGDEEAAAAHFEEAADTIPDQAPGGPSPAVSLAALAVAQTGFALPAARRSARRALTRPGIRHDAWACFIARYAQAFVDHRSGHRTRAWRRARRTLASLDRRLPAPYGVAALRRLIADIECAEQPHPHTPPRMPDRAELPRPALAGIGT